MDGNTDRDSERSLAKLPKHFKSKDELVLGRLLRPFRHMDLYNRVKWATLARRAVSLQPDLQVIGFGQLNLPSPS